MKLPFIKNKQSNNKIDKQAVQKPLNSDPSQQQTANIQQSDEVPINMDKNGSASALQIQDYSDSAVSKVYNPSEAMKRALLNADVKPYIQDPINLAQSGQENMLNIIAPQAIEVDFSYLKIGDVYFTSLFASGYPRYVSPGWLEQIVNFDGSLDISFFIYPIEGKGVLTELRHKVAEMEAEIATDLERGKIVNPSTQAALDDARVLQQTLVTGSEHFFEFGFYITIPARTPEQLRNITKQVQSTLGALLINAQVSALDMEHAFISTLPFGIDKLNITRNMDTTSLATTFPLTSAELSSDEGLLYGINPLNDSFIIFDRFSLENSNMTVFATSGAGKTSDYRTLVLYKNKDGCIMFRQIGELVEDIFKKQNSKIVKLDRVSDGVINPNIEVYGFDSNLVSSWAKVQIAARKNSPKTLFDIKTKSGRTITTTGDHNFVVLKESQITTHKGSKITPGCYIPLTRTIKSSSSNYKPIDVVQVLKSTGVTNLIIRNNRVVIDNSKKGYDMPRFIKQSKAFYQLLGFIVAEGGVSGGSIVITSLSTTVKKIVSNFYSKTKIASRNYIRDKKFVAIISGSKTFLYFIRSLGINGTAGTKRVPQNVFGASPKNITSFLQAYFEGDGGVDGHEISATTKSKGLAGDLAYLLNFFGIIARIGRTKKSATNTKNKTKRTYYRIRISGQDNINKFINEIGFITKRKNDAARKLLKKGNTNVDVIPELGPIFEEIYDVLYSSSKISAPKKFSEIKLGLFKPSPTNLLTIISQIEERVREFEGLESDGLSTLKSLPAVDDIIKIGSSDKTKNANLWQKIGKSWWTMKNNYPPKLKNALMAASLTHDVEYTQQDVTGAVYRSFAKTGESLMAFDKSLWDALTQRKQNPIYQKILSARDYVSEKYTLKRTKLLGLKKKINWLKKLANSDLYWDEIVSVKKVKSKHPYVYDLQVENQVFLAGYGGIFVHNSYFVKLESVRSLMLGAEIIIIDPEAEYKTLSEAVGGQYISFSFSSNAKINPFDLSQVYEEGENQLGLKILSLHSLFRIIMGNLTPSQDALLDRALVLTYRGKGITQDPETQAKEPPLMEDLYKALIGMETDDALDLAARLEKFVKGSFVGIFDRQTNIDINNPFTVFSVKELQDQLRPIAMFVILDFIWTRVKRNLKKRILVVDEAWHMMQYEDSAQFLWGIVKRARKYFLGITTITQDVEDFLARDIGKAVVTNAALRVLLKQSPAAIDTVGDVFYLSEGEKNLLLGANIGEGIFFAGRHHVPMSVVASPEEHKLITTNPQELLDRGMAKNPLAATKPMDLVQEEMIEKSKENIAKAMEEADKSLGSEEQSLPGNEQVSPSGNQVTTEQHQPPTTNNQQPSIAMQGHVAQNTASASNQSSATTIYQPESTDIKQKGVGSEPQKVVNKFNPDPTLR